MSEAMKQIKEAADYLESHNAFKPEFGIILGTGLGGLAKEIDVETSFDYADIPHFPVSTVESHSGHLLYGYLGGKRVVAMQGRFHFYEGYTMQQLTFPVRVMKLLGIKKLVVSNAAGGLNPDYELSDLMVINDHINLLGDNPLTGPNIDELGPRFPDMSDAYDEDMLAQAKEIGKDMGINLRFGVYASVKGPNLETPAEYKYIRVIGGDCVGMSTIPEVIVARHMDIPCFAVSIVTDLGVPGKIEKVSVEHVIAAANKAEPNMTELIKRMLERQ